MKLEHLRQCQVETPPDVVSLLWRLASGARRGQVFDTVLDLGVGDARFACNHDASFAHYLGIELDARKVRHERLPPNARVIQGDALRWQGDPCWLAIGNPPYIRYHRLDAAWREEIGKRLMAESGVALKRTANLYALFLMQALLRTRSDGLVVQLVPFEWVTRPSTSELRQFIRQHSWNVRVYRFDADIFPTVLTTASIVLIDKSKQDGQWEYGVIGRNGTIKAIVSPAGGAKSVLPYVSASNAVRALRGLSPGGQDIFVLTEEQRLCYSLKRIRDVAPCVASLRRVESDTTLLDAGTFHRRYVMTQWISAQVPTPLHHPGRHAPESVAGIDRNQWPTSAECAPVRARPD